MKNIKTLGYFFFSEMLMVLSTSMLYAKLW